VASHAKTLDNDITRLKPANKLLGLGLMGGGVLALIVAYFASTGDHAGQRYLWAYLFGITGFLAISCAALMFTLINHLVRAGWVANVRRVLETIAYQLPLLSILLLPIIATVVLHKNTIYSWSVPSGTKIVHHGAHHDAGHDAGHGEGHTAADAHGAGEPGHAVAGAVPADSHDAHQRTPAGPTTNEHGQVVAAQPLHGGVDDKAVQSLEKSHEKAPGDNHGEGMGETHAPGVAYPNEQVKPGQQRDFDAIIAEKHNLWLNPIFWSIRIPAYFLILSLTAVYYYKSSVKQDTTGDIDISTRLMTLSAPLTFLCGLLVTFVAFDVFMSLDPHWFSTMFGVYFFATGSQGLWAVMCLTFIVLQSRGYLRESVTKDRFHDMGKWLWAFIVFWAYIAYSQYMLQWYANLPEETFWFDKRGYTSAHPNGYTPIVFWGLFVCRLVIPFLGLVSRHVKRSKFGLGFWAAWLLVIFFIDIYHLIMPEFSYTPVFGLPELLCLVGFGGLWMGNIIRTLASAELRPVREPHVHESASLQNAI
jgi:hypothetical protein